MAERRVKLAPEALAVFECHKIVRAGEIRAVSPSHADGSRDLAVMSIDGASAVSVWCEPGMFARTTPEVGDYLVLYEDGYMSFSPRVAFLGGYVQRESTGAKVQVVPRQRRFVLTLDADCDDRGIVVFDQVIPAMLVAFLHAHFSHNDWARKKPTNFGEGLHEKLNTSWGDITYRVDGAPEEPDAAWIDCHPVLEKASTR